MSNYAIAVNALWNQHQPWNAPHLPSDSASATSEYGLNWLFNNSNSSLNSDSSDFGLNRLFGEGGSEDSEKSDESLPFSEFGGESPGWTKNMKSDSIPNLGSLATAFLGGNLLNTLTQPLNTVISATVGESMQEKYFKNTLQMKENVLSGEGLPKALAVMSPSQMPTQQQHIPGGGYATTLFDPFGPKWSGSLPQSMFRSGNFV